MTKLFKTTTLLLCLCLISISSQANNKIINNKKTVYVSTEGNDIKADGSINKPYYSINKALKANNSHNNNQDTLHIVVASGDYFMEETIAINYPSSRPIVIESKDESKPRLIGGLPVNNWEKYENGIYRAYIPEVTKYGFDFEQFYVNGERATLARTPNKEWLFVQNSKEQEFVKGDRIANFAVQQIDFDKSDWSSLEGVSQKELEDMKFRFYHKWDITRKSPKYVEIDSARIFLDGKGMKPWNQIHKGSRYFMYDYMAALDSKGEWFLDRKEGYIYYMPKEGENMDNAFCVAPVLHQLISINGEPNNSVKNITFSNLSFQYSSYLIPNAGEEPMQAAALSEAAIEIDFAENITFDNCEVQHTGAYGMWVGRESHNNKVSHCYLYDLGAGGIKVGEPYLRKSTRKVSSGNIVDNNIIRSAGHEQPCGVGIALFHTADNYVTHNEISDILYSGVSVGWVWGYNKSTPQTMLVMNEKGEMEYTEMPLHSPSIRNTVMHNHIHHIGWGELSDMGAVYTLGESHGTRISHNVIHDIYSYDYGGWGLYTDEGSTGVEMSYNLVYNCKSGGFHQHYGKENNITNNILAFAHTHQLQCTRIEDHLSLSFKNNIVLIDKEDVFKRNWDGANIDADYNMYWIMSGKDDFAGISFKEWKKSKEPHSVLMNPRFKNPKEGDFTFKSKSHLNKIGFKAFDYSKAGVYGDKEWIEKSKLSQERQHEFSRIVEEAKDKEK